jgi:hypothetical protein
MDIEEMINGWNTKYDEGFTPQELADVAISYGLDPKLLRETIGVVTAMVKDNVILTYHCDVIVAVRCCLEGRKPHWTEWD